MNTKIKLLVGATVLGGALAGLAYATPVVGLATPLLSTGTHLANMKAEGSGKTVQGRAFSVNMETSGPASIGTQHGSFAVNGINGWHSHPGMVIVTLISGSLEWFDENCVKTVYHVGDSWVEGSQLHAFRVTGTTAIHFTATFITAHQQPTRTDEAAPACAAGIGLD